MYKLEEIDDCSVSNPHARLVLLEAAIHAERRKGVLRMSQSEMAEHIGLSRRTIARCFLELELHGYLERKGHGRYAVDPVGRPWSEEVKAEHERLQGIMTPGQGIVFDDAGWPNLVEV